MQNPLLFFRPQDKMRFHQRYVKGPGCWEWTSVLKKHGANKQPYAYFFIPLPKDRKKFTSAARIAYVLEYGDFDFNLHVLHKCDNPRCVRPDHLFLGTNLDNIVDKTQKGRASGRRKLSYDALR